MCPKDLRAAQAHARHANPQTTMRYAMTRVTWQPSGLMLPSSLHLGRTLGRSRCLDFVFAQLMNT